MALQQRIVIVCRTVSSFEIDEIANNAKTASILRQNAGLLTGPVRDLYTLKSMSHVRA